jgi:hypothetical protein
LAHWEPQRRFRPFKIFGFEAAQDSLHGEIAVILSQKSCFLSKRMDTYPIPVLFLTFNRPAHTRRVLECLRQLRPERLYLHSDAGRDAVPGEAALVQGLRAEMERAIDWPCTLKKLYRAENQGLRKGVKGAIDWFFEQEPYGVVLEDDCLPDPSFFRFCAELLPLYAADPRIMHIGGSNLAEHHTRHLPESYVFSRFSFVWGWAGWRRAWQQMDTAFEDLETFAASPLFEAFLPNDPAARAYMLDKFRATRAGANNSWAYAWFYSILKNKGLCVVPKRNLVQNVGVGEADATHTRGRNRAAQLPAGSLEFPLRHPARLEPEAALERHFFYTSQKRRHRLLLWRLLKMMHLR